MKRNSIGNDIVSLRHVDAEKSIQSKFCTKFITVKELELFSNFQSSISFLQFVWLCWSIKESVYKFQKRLQPELLFGYKKIIIKQVNFDAAIPNLLLDDLNAGKTFSLNKCISSFTTINNVELYSTSFITNDFIYSMTFRNTILNKLYWEIKKIDDISIINQSDSVRKLSAEKIKKIMGDKHIDILKSEAGYPYIVQHKHIPLSFTHHENHVGYCLTV